MNALLETVMLWTFAGFALLGGVSMLLLRHPMRVALALVGVMLSLAGVFAMLAVHVIAVFQVLIYVGAIMVFMVYVIMLLDVRDASFTTRYSRLLIPGLLVAGLFLAAFIAAVWPAPEAATAAATSASPFGLKTFSRAFVEDYWLPFELTSVLLMAAVVAALAVIKGSRKHG